MKPRPQSALRARAASPHSKLKRLTLGQIRREWRRLRDAVPALESSRQRYADLYDFAPVGYLTLDRNGCIREINATGARLLGRERARLVGGPLLPLIAAADRRKYLGHLSRLRRGQSHARVEVELANHSDPPTVVHLVSVPADAKVHTSFRTALVDITERRRTEQALHESQQRLADIINSAMDAIISVDADQRIMLFNETAEHMFGYPAAAVLGQPLARLIPERFRQAHAQHVHQFGQTGVTARRMGALGQIRGLRANGEEFPIEASISKTRVAGRPVFTVILRDITERTQAEQALREHDQRVRQLNEQLETRVQQRTTELRQINRNLREEIRQRRRLEKEVLDVSEREQQRIGQDLHDRLGQELSGLAFSMEALEHRLTQRNLPESAEAAKLAGRTKQLIARTRNLAKGLFPVELKTRGLVPALNTLAASTEEMFQIACRVHSGEAEQPWAALDESQARQLYRIAQEAAGNAAKHGRGTLIEIRLARRWGYGVLSVSDDGVGLPAAGPPKGHLGLDVMKHRARLIGARLRVKPRRRGGTTVICLLPPRKDNDEHKDPEKIR